jgi:HK97 family phage major capsid protein
MAMTERELLATVQKLYDDSAALLAKQDFGAEDEATVEKMLADAESMKGRIARLAEVRSASAGIIQRVEDEKAAAAMQIAQANVGTDFKSWADFLKAVHKANPRHPAPSTDARLRWFDDKRGGLDAKAMSGDVGADGGFLIPPDFREQLLAALPEGSLIRSGATVWPMASRTIDVPALEQGDLVAGQPAWFGGLHFFWAGEGERKEESQAEFRLVTLRAKKLIGYTVSSDELVADSAISLAGFLTGPLGFTGGTRFMEDVAFLHGVGGNQPLGILNAPVTLEVERDVADEISYPDLLRMMASQLDLSRARWLVSRTAMQHLPLMEGPPGNPRYLWGSAADGIPTSLLGLPLDWTEKLPVLGQRGDIMLVNRQYYVIGDRQAPTVETTQFDRWRYDQTSWRLVHRVDGQPWLDRPIPLFDQVTEVSPFVVLEHK